jgi:hypothetical protein
VRQIVADELAAAAGNDAKPALRVLPERLALERVDLVADEAGDAQGGSSSLAEAQDKRLPGADGSSKLES